jgi:hypothetical protein
MKQYGPIGRREQPCPDESSSLEEAILEQLNSLDPDTVLAFIEFCDDRKDEFAEREATRRRDEADELARDAA